MAPLRYAIHVTLDGCCDHTAGIPNEEMHRHAAANLERADTLLFGRVTYQMMASAWRPIAESGVLPEWAADWTMPFARTIHAARKVVVSSTLPSADWNAELLRGDLIEGVKRLKAESERGVYVGGVALPRALAAAGLIDEYELIVLPRIVGRGPSLFAGLAEPLDLELVGRQEFASGMVALRYVPRR